jgi:hypothetical protein
MCPARLFRPRLRTVGGPLACVWLVVGLAGAYAYLNEYYQHRGFPPLERAPNAIGGKLVRVHFYSSSLRRRDDYLVYLPGGYTPRARYPVLYLLHGMPGRPRSYVDFAHINVRLDNLIGRRRVVPMILVFPDGSLNGDQFSDTEWANTSAGRYESVVIDVVRDVDRRFATVRNRQARPAALGPSVACRASMLPTWTPGTVMILVTQGTTPHAIPVSAVVRAGPAAAVIGLSSRRVSLTRLRADTRVALVVLTSGDVELTAYGRASVVEEAVVEGVAAVRVDIDRVQDHSRPEFVIDSGVSWRWTDAGAQARDAEVRSRLERLAARG